MSPVLLLCLLFPLVASIVLLIALYLKQKYYGTRRSHYATPIQQVLLLKTGGALILGVMAVAILFYSGVNSKTTDVQIFNGEVVSKDRIHDSYVESYQCNCRTVTSGSGKDQTSTQVCDTCYRDHFTVSWTCRSNIGDITIEHLDELSKRVYNTPDPHRYSIIQNGDPVSLSGTYTNWIKAVPDSLFKPLQTAQVQKYAGKLPTYPDQIYDYYKIDRVLGVGVNIPNIKDWNDRLSNSLRILGPTKQANVVILLTNELDAKYADALRDVWVNGKKNDIVVVMGITDFNQPANWVRVLALTKENIFQVHLRDRLLALPNITSAGVIGEIQDETIKTFKRKSMKEFAYLENEILPSEGFMWTMFILVFGFNVGIFFIKVD